MKPFTIAWASVKGTPHCLPGHTLHRFRASYIFIFSGKLCRMILSGYRVVRILSWFVSTPVKLTDNAECKPTRFSDGLVRLLNTSYNRQKLATNKGYNIRAVLDSRKIMTTMVTFTKK